MLLLILSGAVLSFFSIYWREAQRIFFFSLLNTNREPVLWDQDIDYCFPDRTLVSTHAVTLFTLTHQSWTSFQYWGEEVITDPFEFIQRGNGIRGGWFWQHGCKTAVWWLMSQMNQPQELLTLPLQIGPRTVLETGKSGWCAWEGHMNKYCLFRNKQLVGRGWKILGAMLKKKKKKNELNEQIKIFVFKLSVCMTEIECVTVRNGQYLWTMSLS